MAYDRVRVIDPVRGTTEHFRTRIPREAVNEWLEDREALVEAGFPDRPPDVDLPSMRTWVQHPGEEDHPFFVAQRDNQSTGFPVVTARWHGGEDLDISVGLYWNGDHYGLAVAGAGDRVEELHWPEQAIHDADGVRADRPFPDLDDEAVWAEFELALAAFNEAVDWADEPIVTSYPDFAMLAQEVELAKADIARGFDNPMGAIHD